MNSQQALQEFVKENLKELTQADVSSQKIKELQRSYYVKKLSNRISRPSNRDIVRALFDLFKKRGLDTSVIGQYIDEMPVFRLAGESYRDDLLDELTRPDTQSVIVNDVLEQIETVGLYQSAMMAAESQIIANKTEAIEQLEAKIEQKRGEYENFPSILDAEEVPEPDYSPEIDDIKPWWERLYLRGDPFPRKDGLSGIGEDLYNQVLVRTKPFEQTLSSLNKNPDFLFHTAFLLAGDYGFGKTTFIDYLSFYLAQRDILPVRITCARSHPDSSGFLNDFYLHLRNKLKTECEAQGANTDDDYKDLNIDEQIIELCRKVTVKRRGIVIFLDDYHKHRSSFPRIYEFLGLLQILKDALTRNALNVGFIVSGTREWYEELQKNGQLVGFLDNSPIIMPDITPELICAVFNQRIKAYCYDNSPRNIKLDFVKTIFRLIEARTGIRDYINEITTELSNNNLSIIDTPLEIEVSTLDGIRTEIEKDPGLKSSLNKLNLSSRFKNYNQQQIAKCYELLIHVHIQDGVTERDRLFIDNRFYFLLLRDLSLIQKRKLAGKSSDGFKWVLHTRFQSAVSRIFDKYKLGPGDYLLKIYGYKTSSSDGATSKHNLSEPSEEYRQLHDFFGQTMAISKSCRENIATAFRTCDSVLAVGANIDSADQIIKRCRLAIKHLSLALFELDKSLTQFRSADISDVEAQWHEHWLYHNSIQEFFRRVSESEKYPKDNQRKILAVKIFTDVFVYIAECLMVLASDVLGRDSLGFKATAAFHTADEHEIFDLILKNRASGQSDDHFTYVRRITDYLELRMRTFLYATMNLLDGRDYINVLPDEVKKYAYQNLSKRRAYSNIENKFDGLTRPQFRTLFCNGGRTKDQVIDRLRISWLSADWTKFFETYIEENISVAHLQVGTFDVADRAKYLDYAKMFEQLSSAFNQFCIDILTKSVFLISDTPDAANPEQFRIKYLFKLPPSADAPTRQVFLGGMPDGFEQILAKSKTADHVLDPNKYLSVKASIANKLEVSDHGSISEDILDLEYIVNSYGVDWVDFINSLGFACHVEKCFRVHPWFGSSVRVSSGTRIIHK